MDDRWFKNMFIAVFSLVALVILFYISAGILILIKGGPYLDAILKALTKYLGG